MWLLILEKYKSEMKIRNDSLSSQSSADVESALSQVNLIQLNSL